MKLQYDYLNSDLVYIQETAAAAISTATLMKTGQTTSYRTGDDGNIQAGRTTSFSVLADNNPFGNTNRFTDELGSQTYTNNIVIDWSTYNGRTVLGYKRTLQTTATWNNAIDGCLIVSIGTYITGWRMSNVNEICNIWDKSRSLIDKFPTPFSLAGADIWTSTSINVTTAMYLPNSSTIPIFTLAKTNTIRSIAVRDFTVTGTTLT